MALESHNVSRSGSKTPRVGVTGGIGSGKTMVCRIFQDALGIPVFYADDWAKILIEKNSDLRQGIIYLFGPEAYDSGGRYNRALVASIVFREPEKLAALNALVHPAVEKAAQEWHLIQSGQGVPYTIKEAALLVESGSYQHLDFLIVVTAPEQLRLERVMKRDGLDAAQVLARMRRQLPESDKLALADFVVHNDGSTLLLPQIWQIHQQILLKSQS
ncbi:MAG TPA: dephospho-CoA kinase [Saprospirales bacterium]|nr:dephospho-CoA kinase [Saprospirales bacterium]